VRNIALSSVASVALGSVALAGCLNFGKVDDAKIPGELLGTYAVEGSLEDSSCGEGALGSTDPWNFDVKLSRFHEDIYWINGRAVITGGIEPDGVSFAFSTRVEGEVVPPGRGQPGCVLSRSDRADGTLSSKTLDVESFEARLTFAFSAGEGSLCEEWLGSPGFVAALPCSMTYDLTGLRTSE
jgi:hypothetical protein